MFKIETPSELIEKAIELADAARKGGFLALEEANISNPFMQKGIDMLVDGHDADVVRATLQKDIALTTQRHEMGQGFFKALGDIAPAMGMIGTLIGLVAMLSNMDDPKSYRTCDGRCATYYVIRSIPRECYSNTNSVKIIITW